MGLPGHWSSRYNCVACGATKDSTDILFSKNYAPDAPWKPTKWIDMEDWYAHCRKLSKPIPILFRPRSAGGLGLHISCLCKDSLHAVDLGVAKHVNGNVLFHCVYSDMVGGNAQLNTKTIWPDMQDFYKILGVENQFGHITISPLVNDPKSPSA